MTTTPIPTGPAPSAGPSKLMIALIVGAGVLLLAVVAIAFLLIGQNSARPGADGETPVPVATQSPTPSATPTTTPVADGDGGGGGGGGGGETDTAPRFTSFDYNASVECDPSGNEEKPSPIISWSSVNAVAVYWTPNDREATAENGYEVGPSGNQDDMSASKGQGERYEFPCNHEQTFDTTITLVGANGQTESRRVTFTDINWGQSSDDEDE